MNDDRKHDRAGTAGKRPDEEQRDSTSPLQGEWEDDPKRDEEDVEEGDGPLDPLPEKPARRRR